jgi:putative heme-binding domain-containing protein
MATSTASARSQTCLTALMTALVACATVFAQSKDEPAKNPFQPTPENIQAGMVAFRANCAYCHGMDARGMRGPDLTGVYGRGTTEEGLYRTVRRGVPGTEMPPASVFLQEPDTWKVVMYLRTLNVPPPRETARGDAQSGDRIFRTRCMGCHRVNGQGGVLGPDLSRIGVGRTRAALTRQIRGAVEDMRSGYEPVTVTMDGGRTIRGTRKNEDLFSVQIMDTSERLQGIAKSEAKTITADKKSLMPAYGVDQLNEHDLDDLLQYLSTLRGPSTAALP